MHRIKVTSNNNKILPNDFPYKTLEIHTEADVINIDGSDYSINHIVGAYNSPSLRETINKLADTNELLSRCNSNQYNIIENLKQELREERNLSSERKTRIQHLEQTIANMHETEHDSIRELQKKNAQQQSMVDRYFDEKKHLQNRLDKMIDRYENLRTEIHKLYDGGESCE